MNKGKSIFILALTLLPFPLAYFWFQQPMDAEFSLIIPINVLLLGLLIGFCIYTYKSGQVPKEKQHLWAALLVFGNLAVFPFFWYFYMWQSNDSNNGT